MLITVKASFWPFEFTMMPSEPSLKPAEASSAFAFAGLKAKLYLLVSELSSQLENVGVTMPLWFAGGSYPDSPIEETFARSIAYDMACRTLTLASSGLVRFGTTETFTVGGNQ